MTDKSRVHIISRIDGELDYLGWNDACRVYCLISHHPTTKASPWRHWSRVRVDDDVLAHRWWRLWCIKAIVTECGIVNMTCNAMLRVWRIC